MDVRLGRSKNQFIQIILPSIHNEQDESGLPSSAYLPSSINFKLGRSIIESFKSFKYLTSSLIKNTGMHYYLIQ